MGLLFVSLTALPLSLAFYSGSRGSIRSSQPEVSGMIGPWWPFAYVLDTEAAQTDAPDPAPAPDCESHIARNDSIQGGISPYSSNRLSIESILREYEYDNDAAVAPSESFSSAPCPQTKTSTHLLSSNAHPRKTQRIAAGRRTTNPEIASAEIPASVCYARTVLPVIEAREFKERLLKLAVLFKDFRLPEERSLLTGKTSFDCGDSEESATTEVNADEDSEKSYETKKPRPGLVKPEEVCYPEILGEPESVQQP